MALVDSPKEHSFEGVHIDCSLKLALVGSSQVVAFKVVQSIVTIVEEHTASAGGDCTCWVIEEHKREVVTIDFDKQVKHMQDHYCYFVALHVQDHLGWQTRR